LTALGAGTTLCDGRYRLEEVVGRGGMAIVWAATDLQLERRVAIKVISDVLALDPKFVARFEREARIAAGLNHPNLVKLFDYSTEEDRPFLVMEFVPGGTLAEARTSPEPMALARGLLDALAHIHDAGILHRDIKPANVLLSADGSPRLTDFGIARGDDQTALTLTGQVMGTLRYIAPEVAAGEPATQRSDLYSLGVLLGEVAGPGAPEPLAGLVGRLAAVDPVERPTSARQAVADITATRALPRAQGSDPEPGSDPERGSDPYGRTVPSTSREGSDPRVMRTTGSDADALTASLRVGPDPALHIRLHPRRIAAAAVLALVAVIAIVIATSGGGSSGAQDAAKKAAAIRRAVQPAPPGATLDEQLRRLEQIVRSAKRKP
jgi:serine/threonine-protein kinase